MPGRSLGTVAAGDQQDRVRASSETKERTILVQRRTALSSSYSQDFKIREKCTMARGVSTCIYWATRPERHRPGMRQNNKTKAPFGTERSTGQPGKYVEWKCRFKGSRETKKALQRRQRERQSGIATGRHSSKEAGSRLSKKRELSVSNTKERDSDTTKAHDGKNNGTRIETDKGIEGLSTRSICAALTWRSKSLLVSCFMCSSLSRLSARALIWAMLSRAHSSPCSSFWMCHSKPSFSACHVDSRACSCASCASWARTRTSSAHTRCLTSS
jgi:hypothetical protein